MTFALETHFPELSKLHLLITLKLSAILFCSLTGNWAFAHVEFYDLNQGQQISELTSAGKNASNVQYGANPSVSSLSGINTLSDRPLNNPNLWNSSYHVYTGAGTFSSVVYSDNLSTATVDVDDVTDWGWGDGTWGTDIHTSPTGTGLLADSHKIDFFNFRLTKPSLVTITWNIDTGGGYFIDSGFTLFRGVTSYQAHDASTDPLNPEVSSSNTARIQDPLDTGSVLDAQGIASAFRDTVNNAAPYLGQFNALDNWGDGNATGNWSNVSYIVAVNEHNPLAGYSTNSTETTESLTIQLQPGNYTIAASGALTAKGSGPGSFSISNMHGRLTYNATAIELCP